MEQFLMIVKRYYIDFMLLWADSCEYKLPAVKRQARINTYFTLDSIF